MGAIFKQTTTPNFFRQLWGSLVDEEHWIELRFGAIEKPRRKEDLTDREELSILYATPFEDIYFGLHLRGPEPGGISLATAFYAQFPFSRESYTSIQRRLKAFRMAPTVVVDAGYGLEVYWFGKHAFRFPEFSVAGFLDHQRSLQRELGALVAEDLLTFLTVPKTVKREFRDTPKQTCFLFADYSRRYEL